MTEDIRDEAREARESQDAPQRAQAPAATSETMAVPPAEPVSEAEGFGAETVNAERLKGPEEPDYKDRWLRAEAEIQNTRRRAARDRDDAVRMAQDRVLLELIEILDDLERALAALTPEQAADPWSQGVALTAQRMRDALTRLGVTTIPTLGQPFDPAFHEALLEVPAAQGIAPGSVAQEVQKGYRRGERALRAARVVVARANG
jgi:molecular chaperone GrpE